MIRILFFIETLEGGGAEKVLRNLVNHMDQTRFDITVQTVWPCEAEKYLVSGIHYRSIYTNRTRVNELRYRMEAACGLAYRFHIRDDYDIECAYLEMGSTKIMSASTNKKAKKLAWVHCDINRALENPSAFAKKAGPWYKRFDRIVCVSKSVKASFDQLFQNRFHSVVIYNVIDDAAILKMANMQMPKIVTKRRFTVLSVGRLSFPKNYMLLLQAHKRLRDEGLEHDLWILGEGSERAALEDYIEDNHLSDSVFMPGFVSNPYPFMKTADLLICSSVYEGFSTFATEAIMLGKPFVTTDVSGMRELLGDSEYGLIVPNDDVDFLDGYRRMLSDDALREHYRRQALLRKNELSASTTTETIQVFFESLLRN